MSLNNQIFIGDYVPATNKALTAFGVGSTHTATAYVNGIDLLDPLRGDGVRSGVGPEASGIIIYLNLTAIGNGTDTIQLVLQEQDPTSLTWATIAATLVNPLTLGLTKLKLKDAIAAAAATVTGVAVQDKLPRTWRFGVVHSGVSSFTYSIGVTLYA